MQIVDAQVHANAIGSASPDTDPNVTITAAVAAMDAVGVDAVVVDEYWGVDEDLHVLPGHLGPGGAWREDQPFSEVAVATHPERFAYVTRVDYRDPEIPQLLATFRNAPGRLALRLYGSIHHGFLWEDPAFVNGEYRTLFEHAELNNIPVFVLVSSRLDTLEQYIKSFPDLRLIIDHMGVSFPAADARPKERYSELDAVCAFAKHENVALKWSHVERLAAEPYPYLDAMPHFRKVVDAFGAERVMWASDHTQTLKPNLSPHPSSWAQSLHYVMDSELFSDTEKEWILGRSVIKLLGWNR